MFSSRYSAYVKSDVGSEIINDQWYNSKTENNISDIYSFTSTREKQFYVTTITYMNSV